MKLKKVDTKDNCIYCRFKQLFTRDVVSLHLLASVPTYFYSPHRIFTSEWSALLYREIVLIIEPDEMRMLYESAFAIPEGGW